MEKDRIQFLDWAKGIGIVLVILGHIEFLPSPYRVFITAFHMPLFFVISGMVLYVTKETKRESRMIIKRKAKGILIPYLVYSILCLGVNYYCYRVLNSLSWEVIREQIFSTVCLIGASVFWFLPALFFGELFFVFLRKKTSGKATAGIVALLFVAAYFLHLEEKKFLASYGTKLGGYYTHLVLSAMIRIFFVVAFIAIGYAGYKVLQKLTTKFAPQLLMGILLLGISALFSHFNGVTDMNFMVYNHILYYAISSICGAFGIIILCRAMENFPRFWPMRICAYYGKNSLIIMMTHMSFCILYFALCIVGAINSHILSLRRMEIVCLAVTCAVLVMEIPIIEIINRFLPFTLGKKSSAKSKSSNDTSAQA